MPTIATCAADVVELAGESPVGRCGLSASRKADVSPADSRSVSSVGPSWQSANRGGPGPCSRRVTSNASRSYLSTIVPGEVTRSGRRSQASSGVARAAGDRPAGDLLVLPVDAQLRRRAACLPVVGVLRDRRVDGRRHERERAAQHPGPLARREARRQQAVVDLARHREAVELTSPGGRARSFEARRRRSPRGRPRPP